MSEEIRAAAMRISQSGFVWTGDIPVGPGRWTGNPEDAIKLAEAYLAEHDLKVSRLCPHCGKSILDEPNEGGTSSGSIHNASC